jgi:integrase/recombinase XerD
MSAMAVVDSDLLLSDVRHLSARAAPDLADWLVHLELEGKADRTLYGYMRYIAGLLREHPEKRIEEFTHTDLNEFLRVTPKGSRHIVRSVLNQFFDWARLDDRVEKNPVDRVPKMRHPRRRPKDIFSEVEIELLESLPSPDGQLWTLLFGSGLRRGEARRLQWGHVSLERARLTVYHGKGDKDRIIPLPLAVLSALADLEKFEGLRREDHLWYSRPGGGRRKSRLTPIGDTTFEHWYKRGIKEAGVRYLNPHQTRHAFGHRLRELGFDLEERQLLMGHEDIGTTSKYYGHLTIEDVARKVAAL